MTARALVLLAAVGVAGCDAATTVLLDVSLRSGDPTPVAVKVGVYGPQAVLAHDKVVPLPSLPGTLVLRGLPAGATPLRIGLVDIDGRVRGAATVTSAPHHQVEVPVVLSAAIGDADGDGVPDPIDVCPKTADPAQQTDASGQGLACGGLVPDGFVPLDLAEPTDLAGSDGAPPDLASTDLAKPFTACPGGYLLCESFELNTISTAWTELRGGGQFVFDKARAAYGTTSLQLAADLTTAPSFPAPVQLQIYEYKTFPHDPLYVRFSLYLPSSFPSLSVNLVLVQANTKPNPGVQLGFDGRTPWIQSVNVPGGPGQRFAAKPLPADTWMCVEVKISMGGSQVWLDGVELTDLALPGFATVLSFDNLFVGIDTSVPAGTLNGTTFNLGIDELAVDATRIGCLP